MTLIINGEDFSSDFTPYLTEFTPERVSGVNQGVSMGGTEIVDLLRVQRKAAYSSGLLTQDRLTKIVSLASLPVVSVIYDDPFTGEERGPVEMIPEVGSFKRIPLWDGRNVYKGLTLSLRDK